MCESQIPEIYAYFMLIIGLKLSYYVGIYWIVHEKVTSDLLQ